MPQSQSASTHILSSHTERVPRRPRAGCGARTRASPPGRRVDAVRVGLSHGDAHGERRRTAHGDSHPPTHPRPYRSRRNAAHGPRGFPRPAIGSDRDSRRGTPRNTAHQITRIKYTNHDKPDNTSQHIGCGARRVDVPHRQQGSMPQSVITSRCAAHPNPIIQSSNHPIIHLYARRTPRPKAMRGGRHVRKQCAADTTFVSKLAP